MASSRIGQEYYDTSDYFERAGAEHVTNPHSRFQRYRVAKVLEIHRPRPGDRVVDLGCGWGTFGFALAPTVAEVTGVDFSERSIAYCRRRLEEGKGTDLQSRLRFIQADAGATGLPSEGYDVVIAADLFEHLYPEDSERVAAEAYRLLRAGGRFVTWTPHRGHFLEALKDRNIFMKRDETHVDYKSMQRMRDLLEGAGFQIERAYYAESHLPGLRVVERLAQGFVPFLRRRIAVLGRKPAG